MTRPQSPPHQQRIPLKIGGPNAPGITTEASPLEAMTIMQLAVEGGRERIEETQTLRPIAPEAAERIVRWAGEDSLDWDHLIGSIDGWGTPEP